MGNEALSIKVNSQVRKVGMPPAASAANFKDNLLIDKRRR